MRLLKDIRIPLGILLLLDIGYSFLQHYHVALDGDMARIIVPSEDYKKVLADPFGTDVLFHDEVYAAPNRFFAHILMQAYFKTVPFLLQHIVSPVDSIYLSCAFAKTGIQLLIFYLLSVFISGKSGIFSRGFLLAGALIAPLFQTFGYNGIIGIIDHSITYTFFYAFALGLMLWFFLPFFKASFYNNENKFGFALTISLLLISVVISFHGPLNPPVILIVCPLVISYQWMVNFRKHQQLPLLKKVITSFSDLPKQLSFIFTFVSMLCLYSLYVGMNNSENLGQSIPLSERYARLLNGLYSHFTNKLALPLLALIIITNALIIYRQKRNDAQTEMLRLLKWIGLFTVIYIVLLPLGGYRQYRPNIIRSDTLMPVVLVMIFYYGISSRYLITSINPVFRKLYFSGIAVFLLIFTCADAPGFNHNKCEKSALNEIAHSSEKIFPLKNECTVMSWGKIHEPETSRLNCELLLYWGVIKENKLYYQQ